MLTFLRFLPDLLTLLGRAVRAANRPDISYMRTPDRRWIALYRGYQFTGDTRPEAAQGVLRLAAGDA